MGLTELPSDERFATNAGRVEHRGELVPLLAERFRERSAEEWLADLDAAGVPAGKVRTVPDALAAAAAAGRAGDGDASSTRRRGRWSWWPRRSGARRDPTRPRRRSSGEHTAEVLGELGRSEERDRASWRRGGVVGLPAA